jgi:hypothetical protein
LLRGAARCIGGAGAAAELGLGGAGAVAELALGGAGAVAELALGGAGAVAELALGGHEPENNFGAQAVALSPRFQRQALQASDRRPCARQYGLWWLEVV